MGLDEESDWWVGRRRVPLGWARKGTDILGAVEAIAGKRIDFAVSPWAAA